MADKTTILRAFNTHLFEFLDDVIAILPDNVGLVTTILKDTGLDVNNAVSIVCGPPIMMKFVYHIKSNQIL